MEGLIEELKAEIIEELNLEGVSPADIDIEEPLFNTGLGLDSIDALELVAMLEKHYGILIQERKVAEQAFASIRALARFVADNRKPCA